jgi:hypothetical protein
MKTIIALTSITLLLSSCANLPSPQNTSPDHASRCKAIQMQISNSQALGGSGNNSSPAVTASQNEHLAQVYKDECSS